MSAPANDEQLLNRVITVKEAMEIFGIRQPGTVIMACLTGRVTARKADADVGVRGGVWLISAESATKFWRGSK